MTLYIGVDFHPHQQTVCWCDTRTGETETKDLMHDLESVRKFYTSLREPAVVGIEATARAVWFENMLFETGHKLFVGNPVLIRKRATSRCSGRSAISATSPRWPTSVRRNSSASAIWTAVERACDRDDFRRTGAGQHEERESGWEER